MPADSSAKLLDEVIVTATCTENKVPNIPMIQGITYKTIQHSGSQKLIDIVFSGVAFFSSIFIKI